MEKFIKRISIFASLTLVLLISTAFNAKAQVPNQDLKMMSVSGKEYSVKDLAKENGLLIIFISNTCDIVIKNQQRATAVSDVARRKNIGVVYINSNEKERNGTESLDAMKAYSNGQNFNWEYLVDKNGTFATGLGATKTPECYLFNKDMKLVYQGAIDDNPADELGVMQQYLRTAVDQLAAGKEVTTKKSKVIGCSIKK